MKNKTNYKQTEIGEIPEDWSVVPLEKLIDIKHGFAYKGKYFSAQITNDVLLTPGNVAIGGGFQGEKYKYYSGEVPSDYVFSAGDIFVNMTDLSKTGDTLGYSAKVPQVDGKRFLHNQRLGLVEFVSNDTDKEFIYWKLRDPFYRNTVLGSATGTTVKHTSPGRIKSIRIALPAKNEQQQIASILSSLDDKIELNRKMNKTLEDMGKALFKRWFVDFEFPNENDKPYKSSGGEMVNSELGEKPVSWKIVEINDFGKIVCGKTPPKNNQKYFGGNIPFIKIPDMHGKMFIIKTEDSLTNDGADYQKNKTLPKGSICVSCIATVGLVCIITQNSQTNQQINSIILNKSYYTEYLYFVLSSMKKQLQDFASGGSATLNLNTGSFSNIPMLSPSNELLEKFHSVVESIFEQVMLNAIENERLSAIRDSLLPRLMSGKLRV